MQFSLARVAAVAAASCFLSAANAAPVTIEFGTLAMTTTNAFKGVLASAGIIPAANSPLGALSGRFTYDDATAGVTNMPGNTRNFNGAVDALSFSVSGWFSQSLSGIGNNGDLRVRRNAGTNDNIDDLRVTVTCSPIPNNTTAPGTCAASPGNFSYSFVDPATQILWALDTFTLLLQETGSGNVLDNLDLPSRSEWESPDWTVERVTLRFNPFGDDLSNGNVNGAIDFLAVPEPGGLALAGLAIAALAAASRRRKV